MVSLHTTQRPVQSSSKFASSENSSKHVTRTAISVTMLVVPYLNVMSLLLILKLSIEIFRQNVYISVIAIHLDDRILVDNIYWPKLSSTLTNTVLDVRHQN